MVRILINYRLKNFANSCCALPTTDRIGLNTEADNFMCSFDVKSFFTNVPFDDTIEIILCINALYFEVSSFGFNTSYSRRERV